VKQVVDLGDEELEQWKESALEKWSDDEFLQALLNLENKIQSATSLY
jgi:hypothetical protein